MYCKWYCITTREVKCPFARNKADPKAPFKLKRFGACRSSTLLLWLWLWLSLWSQLAELLADPPVARPPPFLLPHL